ncbi:MAG: GTPase ObgE [Phycisphaerales bacterium]|nr:GTPase ObgE [Phycisphaerales bacterium]
MLVDRAEIYVRAGKGGDGCVSFRREKFIPKGGPDGGDGGDGGNVYMVATPGVDTLLDFAGKHHWIAESGRPGMGKKMFGKKGEDLLLKLPIGTLIFDRDTDILIKDLGVHGERICIAQAGKGGRGNAKFATSTHQTPREFEPGTPGQERWLRLELKMFADAGIVGLPNAGKSTLLSRLSRAKPKIADYPFTTLEPQLGIVELPGLRRFVLADIPGLIEGAHEGAGLGDAFLRHIERTRVILHVVDVGSEYAAMLPAEAYATIRGELSKYSEKLASKEELVVANKVDLTGGADAAKSLADAIGKDVLPISAVAGIGLPEMVERLWDVIRRAKEADAAAEAAQVADRAESHPPQPSLLRSPALQEGGTTGG